MSRALPTLSEGIDTMLSRFTPLEGIKDNEVAEIDAASVKNIVRSLRLMRIIATNMERELNVYRLIDAGRVFTGTVEQLAQDTAAGLVLETSGNIIKPDFGRAR